MIISWHILLSFLRNIYTEGGGKSLRWILRMENVVENCLFDTVNECVKNGYFAFRLTISVDSPPLTLRSAFRNFVVVVVCFKHSA